MLDLFVIFQRRWRHIVLTGNDRVLRLISRKRRSVRTFLFAVLIAVRSRNHATDVIIVFRCRFFLNSRPDLRAGRGERCHPREHAAAYQTGGRGQRGSQAKLFEEGHFLIRLLIERIA